MKTFSLILCVTITLAAWSAPVPADTKLPNTPAGALLSKYIKLCNAPDNAAFTRFSEEHAPEKLLKRIPAARLAEQDMAFCEGAAGIDLHSFKETGPQEIEALVHERATDSWTRIIMKVAPEPPHRIVNFGQRPGDPPEGTVAHGMADEQVAAELGRYLTKVAASDRFSGVVLLAKDGKPVFEHAYGMADAASKRPNTMDSIFTIGSMGKMFTAVAVAQLVEKGKLSFDDKVGKVLPDYANKDVREKVTISQLLTHTSGLGDFLGKRTDEMKKSGVKRAADYVPLFEKDPLRFEPGKGWSYSNAGFALAGAIIEKVSGENYFSYIREHVFKPAGMKDCDTNETRRVPPKMVTPYTHKENGRWNEREAAERDIGNPAGGSSCTAPDLLRFAEALRQGKLVSKKLYDELTTPHSEGPGGGKYGYGFGIRTAKNGRRTIGHGGGFPGVSTNLAIYPDQGYVLVVLSNYDPGTAEMVSAKVSPMILLK